MGSFFTIRGSTFRSLFSKNVWLGEAIYSSDCIRLHTYSVVLKGVFMVFVEIGRYGLKSSSSFTRIALWFSGLVAVFLQIGTHFPSSMHSQVSGLQIFLPGFLVCRLLLF